MRLHLRLLGFARLILGCLATAALLAADTAPVVTPSVSYQFPEVIAVSPAVSYIFFEATGTSPSTPLVSGVVSYEFFEWPSVLTSVTGNSPPVSFFYNWGGGGPPLALRGQVLDAAGQPVAGAQVAATVFATPAAETVSGADGTFELPALPPAVYTLSALKQDFVPSQRVCRLEPATAWQPFQLIKLPLLPETETAGSTPAVAADVLDPLLGAKLRAFGETAFAADASSASSSWMTVVLTHGWAASADSTGDAWPKAMAGALRAKLGPSVNLLAWDWPNAAAGTLPPCGSTPGQGLALGKELGRWLGENYSHPIHFIGHSLGTLVNAQAADYLHGVKVAPDEPAGPGWPADQTYVTLLDDAELAGRLGQALVYAALTASESSADDLFRQGLIDIAKTVSVKPVPEQAGWIDNYISAVGFQHDQAVNVCLQTAASLFSDKDWLGSATRMHGYAVDWYQDSITEYSTANPPANAMGFVNSYERESLLAPQPAFPPSYEAGTAFHQDPAAGSKLVVVPWTCDGCAECNAPALNLIHSALAAGGTVVWPNTWGKVIQDGAVTLEFVSRPAIGAATAVFWIGSPIGGMLHSVVDLVNTPSLRIHLTTGLPPILDGGRVALHDGEPGATNTPAYVWMPVFVPADAAVLVFDFTVSGEPKEDGVACGINGTNLFSLQAKFVSPGDLATSSPIDMAPYTGTTNEFFFGVVGGTSTNCTVTVEGLRFYTFAAPTLSITTAAGLPLLSWPTTAIGYSLETTPSLSPPAWIAVADPPAVLGKQYVVTNAWPDQTRFFRLRQE